MYLVPLCQLLCTWEHRSTTFVDCSWSSLIDSTCGCRSDRGWSLHHHPSKIHPLHGCGCSCTPAGLCKLILCKIRHTSADLLACQLHTLVKLKPTRESDLLQSRESVLFQFRVASKCAHNLISAIEGWEQRQFLQRSRENIYHSVISRNSYFSRPTMFVCRSWGLQNIHSFGEHAFLYVQSF